MKQYLQISLIHPKVEVTFGINHISAAIYALESVQSFLLVRVLVCNLLNIIIYDIKNNLLLSYGVMLTKKFSTGTVPVPVAHVLKE